MTKAKAQLQSSDFSVVIPVKDGERYLGELLASLQKYPDLEILVIDSGSTDHSLEIVRAAGEQVRLLEIDPSSFGHGKTRNLGAEKTSGKYICFLTQDATPVDGWLEAISEAFTIGERVGAVYGPHLPRPDTSPMVARELTEYFAGFTPDGNPALQGMGDTTFLSNVNACYLRECWQEIKFRDLDYAEDQAFGIDMLAADWKKVYHPNAAVLHAHDYRPIEFVKRYFDEYRGLRETSGHIESTDLDQFAGTVKNAVAGDRTWMQKQGFKRVKLGYWTARSAFHHGGRKVGAILGSRADKLSDNWQRRLSLEGRSSTQQQTDDNTLQLRSIPPQLPVHQYEVIRRFEREGAAPLLPANKKLAKSKQLNVAFVIPPFDRNSGGHGTIFKIVAGLERLGHNCSLWINDPFGAATDLTAKELKSEICEHFIPLKAEVFKEFKQWQGANVVIATGWQTVYPVMMLNNCHARAYLVQDYEPFFYPTSVESAWATNTYNFGLHTISASQWLNDLLEEKHGYASGSIFELGIDHSIYRPNPNIDRKPQTVIFYGRNSTPRRAVTLGVLALDELKRRLPDLEVRLYGGGDPPLFAFPYRNLGMVTPQQLTVEYAEATVGLCLSLTNYSLVPKEMLACGLPCVELAGFSCESIFGSDGPIELAQPNAIAIADAMERLITDQALWQQRSKAGIEFGKDFSWERVAGEVEDGIRAALRTAAKGGVKV